MSSCYGRLWCIHRSDANLTHKIVSAAKDSNKPVIAKLTPNVTILLKSCGSSDAGADALTLINSLGPE